MGKVPVSIGQDEISSRMFEIADDTTHHAKSLTAAGVDEGRCTAYACIRLLADGQVSRSIECAKTLAIEFRERRKPSKSTPKRLHSLMDHVESLGMQSARMSSCASTVTASMSKLSVVANTIGSLDCICSACSSIGYRCSAISAIRFQNDGA